MKRTGFAAGTVVIFTACAAPSSRDAAVDAPFDHATVTDAGSIDALETPGDTSSANDAQVASDAARDAIDPTRRPFAADSPWNARIPADAQYTDNADLRSTPEVWVNNGAYGIALYVTDPALDAVTIDYPAGYGTVPAGRVTLHTGLGLAPPAGTDGTITVIDPAAGMVYDFWQLTGTGAMRTATNGVPTSLHGSGAGDPTGGAGGRPLPAGIRAAWTSAAGGLLRGADMRPGAVIDHALACSLLNAQLRSGPVFPIAVAEDGYGASTYAGSIPMGTHLAIPHSVDLATLNLTSEIGRRVAVAAQTYGIWVVDRHNGTSALTLYSTPTEVTDADVAPLRTWWTPDGQDLLKVRNALRVVH